MKLKKRALQNKLDLLDVVVAFKDTLSSTILKDNVSEVEVMIEPSGERIQEAMD